MAVSSLLTTTQINNLKDPGRYHDGAGLYLIVTKTGARRWELLINKDNKRSELSLGPDEGLANARYIASQVKKAVDEGIEPKQAAIAARSKKEIQEHVEGARTFNYCLEEVLKLKESELKNEKNKAQWRSSLETYACPYIGNKPVSDINLDDIENILRPIWTKIPVTADRVRSRVKKVLAYAIVKKWRGPYNPAEKTDNLEFILPKQEDRSNKHHEAMDYEILPEFMFDLRRKRSTTAKALEFTILTASRTQESLYAKWGEIDLSKKIWTVPPERMKDKKLHRVPLTDRMIEIISALPRFEGEPHLFPSPQQAKKGQGMSNMSMLKFLQKDLGYPELTVHGFRSTFKDYFAEETEHDWDISEAAVSHKIKNKARAAYERGDKLKRRVELMKDWEAYCAEAEL